MLTYKTAFVVILIFRTGAPWRLPRQYNRLAGWGPWSEWQCSVTCGGGIGQRIHTCLEPGPNTCLGRKRQHGPCNEQPCPVNSKLPSAKGWSEWTSWECPVTCGIGTNIRSRSCLDPDICEGPNVENGEKCHTTPCPADLSFIPPNIRAQIYEKFKSATHSFQLQEGESVTLPCKGDSAAVINREYPNSNVTWSQNGETLTKNDGRTIDKEKGSMVIKEVTSKDNGVYICMIFVLPGIKVPGSFASIAVQNNKPDVEIEIQEPLILRCHGELISYFLQEPLYETWYHNSTVHSKKVISKPSDIVNLRIVSAEYDNRGIWVCEMSLRDNKGNTLRKWATNTIRVDILPTKSLNYAKYAIGVICCLTLFAAIAWFYCKRMKNGRGKNVKAVTKLLATKIKKAKKRSARVIHGGTDNESEKRKEKSGKRATKQKSTGLRENESLGMRVMDSAFLSEFEREFAKSYQAKI